MGCQNANGTENENEKIRYTNESLFTQKVKDFMNSYKSNSKSVAFIADFDYTITARYDYEKNVEFKSSYYLYDSNIIGKDMKEFDENIKKLTDQYSKYEFNTSYDYEIRYEKLKAWYTSSLLLYKDEKFTLSSIDKMVDARKDKIKFREGFVEYLNLVISMGIPLIIISGGVTQFIIAALKLVVPNIETYIEEKKVAIISNTLKFDQEKGCVGVEDEVIFCFNKADFLRNVVKDMLPDLKHVFVLGDHLGDGDCTKKLDVPAENITGLGFLNLSPEVLNDPEKKNYVEQKVDEYKAVFDVILVGNSDYNHIINYIEKINN